MRAQPVRLVSWYWLAGYLLLHEAQQLVDFDLSEHQLREHVLAELRQLPAVSQHAIRSLPFTEKAITVATNQQHAILTIAFRRVLTALKREQPQRQVLAKGGEPM